MLPARLRLAMLLALPLVSTFMPATLPMRFVSPTPRSAVCAARIAPALVMTELQPGESGYKRAKFKKLLRRAFQPGKVAAEREEAAEAAAYKRRTEEKAAAKKSYEEELERDLVAAEKAIQPLPLHNNPVLDLAQLLTVVLNLPSA